MARVAFAALFVEIEPMRVEPNQAQPLADRILSQIFKEDAKTLAIRKLCVILSCPLKSAKTSKQ
jgi:hypothetical protein